MDRTEQMQKIAVSLGREAALEKTAFWGALKGLYAGLRSLGTGTAGRVGGSIVKAVEPHSAAAAKWLARAGRGATKDMWGFGMFGGGLGALLNPEDRLGGFARGFAGGSLGGLGWRAGGNLARYGMRAGAKALGPKAEAAYERAVSTRLSRPLTKAEQATQAAGGKVPGWWARRRFGAGREMTMPQAAALLGQKAALGVVPLGAAFFGSSLAPTFEGGGQGYDLPQQPAFIPSASFAHPFQPIGALPGPYSYGSNY